MDGQQLTAGAQAALLACHPATAAHKSALPCTAGRSRSGSATTPQTGARHPAHKRRRGGTITSGSRRPASPLAHSVLAQQRSRQRVWCLDVRRAGPAILSHPSSLAAADASNARGGSLDPPHPPLPWCRSLSSSAPAPGSWCAPAQGQRRGRRVRENGVTVTPKRAHAPRRARRQQQQSSAANEQRQHNLQGPERCGCSS